VTDWEALCGVVSSVSENPPVSDPSSAELADLVDLAERHRVLPALANHLPDDGPTPGDAEADLRSRRRRQARAGLLLAGVLGDVLEWLADEGVDAIAYKGPVLSQVAYDDVGARQYGDVDVFVGQSSFDRARACLESRGFEPVERLPALGEVALRNDDGAVVDLHAHLLPRYHPATLPFEKAWQRRTHVDVGGTAVPALGPADRFVVLAVHGTKHCWYRLAWIADVAALLDADHADFDAVSARAGSVHAHRHVLLACWLARRCLSAELSPPVAEAVASDAVVERLGHDVLERLRSGDVVPPDDGEQFGVQYRMLERRRDRIRYVTSVATIPSEADRATVSLPEPLSPLYRVIRPVRLATSYGRRAIARGG